MTSFQQKITIKSSNREIQTEFNRSGLNWFCEKKLQQELQVTISESTVNVWKPFHGNERVTRLTLNYLYKVIFAGVANNQMRLLQAQLLQAREIAMFGSYPRYTQSRWDIRRERVNRGETQGQLLIGFIHPC